MNTYRSYFSSKKKEQEMEVGSSHSEDDTFDTVASPASSAGTSTRLEKTVQGPQGPNVSGNPKPKKRGRQDLSPPQPTLPQPNQPPPDPNQAESAAKTPNQTMVAVRFTAVDDTQKFDIKNIEQIRMAIFKKLKANFTLNVLRSGTLDVYLQEGPTTQQALSITEICSIQTKCEKLVSKNPETCKVVVYNIPTEYTREDIEGTSLDEQGHQLPILEVTRLNRREGQTLSPISWYFEMSHSRLQLEVDIEDEDSLDRDRDIARAAYADMLHDLERNVKYELAIAKVIKGMKLEGREVNTLDIGTGTGLLSMMAARHGASSVYSCEAFEPMAKCAVDVIKENGFSESINVIPKRSTELRIGEDLPKKANLVVAELYDTELIGEGAIGSYNHAKQSLLDENVISVPARATVYAQLVECELALKWNRPQRIPVGEEGFIEPPPEALICGGAAAVHDLQMAQLDPNSFKPISEPIEVFQFDWMSREPVPSHAHTRSEVTAIEAGTIHAIFFWWSTDMDPEGEIVISCAPPWAHPEGLKGPIPWRDHWMQAIYYIPKEVIVASVGDSIYLDSFHDEYSVWFSVDVENRPQPAVIAESRPICNCLVHLAYSRTRLGLLNDRERNAKYVEILQRHLVPGMTVLSLGDGSLLPLIAAKLGAKKVIALESNTICRKVLERYVFHNGLKEIVHILDKTVEEMVNFQLDGKIDLVIGEPYFETASLAWENTKIWKATDALSHILSKDCKILPSKMVVRGVGVRFHDLHKIQAPIVETCGFSMQQFDDLIQRASIASDETVEPHPLWEYPCTALTKTFDAIIATSTATERVSEMKEVALEVSDELNGVALWCDWYFDSVCVSSGPVEPIEVGKQIKWDIHSKQGCYFFKKSHTVKNGQLMSVTANRLVHDLSFEFTVLVDN